MEKKVFYSSKFLTPGGHFVGREYIIYDWALQMIGALRPHKLYYSFSSPPALPFFLPHQGFLVPLVAECSHLAPFKVGALLEQSKKTASVLSRFSWLSS